MQEQDSVKPSDIFKAVEEHRTFLQSALRKSGKRAPLIPKPPGSNPATSALPRLGHKRGKIIRRNLKPNAYGLAITEEFLRRQRQSDSPIAPESEAI